MASRQHPAPVWFAVTWMSACGFGCSSSNGATPAARNSASSDASLDGDSSFAHGDGAPTSDAAPEPEANDGDAVAPVTCTWTPGDHASACATTPCPIVEDVNVNCTDNHFAWPGVRVAPAPGATWLVTASENERYAFSIKNGFGTPQEGVPPGFAYQTIWLALSPDGSPELATDDLQTIVGEMGGYVNGTGTFYEALGQNGWLGWLVVQPPPSTKPVVGLQPASDGTPNVWIGYGPADYQRVTPGDSGSIFTPAPVPTNGEGENRFTLARNGEPVSFDVVAGPGLTPPFQLHALIGGLDRPLGAADLDGGMELGPYTVADFPSPSQPDAGALAAAAILEADGIHVAWLDAQGSTETVVPSTGRFEFSCPPPAGACPTGTCHETGAGVSAAANQQGDSDNAPAPSPPHDFALAWTSDGLAWLAYVVTRYDAQVHYMAQPGSAVSCLELVDSLGASRVLHLARVPLDGSPAVDVLSLPIASTGGIPGYYSAVENGAQAVTARFFDVRAFGTDLAIGLQTTDSNGVGTVRVLRVDTTLATSPR